MNKKISLIIAGLTWCLGLGSVITSDGLEVFTFHGYGRKQIRIAAFLQMTSILRVTHGTVKVLGTVIHLS